MSDKIAECKHVGGETYGVFIYDENDVLTRVGNHEKDVAERLTALINTSYATLQPHLAAAEDRCAKLEQEVARVTDLYREKKMMFECQAESHARHLADLAAAQERVKVLEETATELASMATATGAECKRLQSQVTATRQATLEDVKKVVDGRIEMLKAERKTAHGIATSDYWDGAITEARGIIIAIRALPPLPSLPPPTGGRWTTEKPTKEGWTWYRSHVTGNVYVTKLVVQADKLYSVAHEDYLCDLVGGEWQAVEPPRENG